MESDFKRKLYTIMKVQRFSVQGSEVLGSEVLGSGFWVLGKDFNSKI
jgi:hypothetical protein